MNTLLAITDFVVYVLLQWVIWLLIAYAVVSWLVAFNVVNTRNRFVAGLIDALDRFFTPILRPIRRILPDFGGIDLSPMVLWAVIVLIQMVYGGIVRDIGVR